ncbi:MAG: DUF3368 domain-containing protein [Jaaginema sp. PMC 1079.18]|nr:DUF3368 domain-containing protein [Jaaginema sp. PMC 1080.18]MEC4852132.1 DUF3368 domain-containing protein [Jaaginema sp. PMC 1079.18]MEC4867656.1 DUF3368 domain-containing protein [Jaaginema sp. PMC 1078.18]
MIVVSDTSPICYLLLIGEIELLAKLYGKVLIPQVVQQELLDAASPEVVRNWIGNPPGWLEIEIVDLNVSEGLTDLEILDPGEKSAIALAQQRKADLIIIDDGLGRQVACSLGLKITGLLGVLDEAAKRDLVNFPQAILCLQTTTFRASAQLIQSLLERYR